MQGGKDKEMILQIQGIWNKEVKRGLSRLLQETHDFMLITVLLQCKVESSLYDVVVLTHHHTLVCTVSRFQLY